MNTWGVLASAEVWEVVRASWDDGVGQLGWVSFSADEARSLLDQGGASHVLVEARLDLLRADVVGAADASQVVVVALVTGPGGDDVASGVGVVPRVRQPDDLSRLVSGDPSQYFVTAAEAGEAAPPLHGVSIGVWGPTGAPGRTTVSAVLATLLARRGIRTLLVDADARSGSVAPALGLLDEVPGFVAACRLADRGQLTAADLHRLAHHYDATGSGFDVLTGVTTGRVYAEVTADTVADVVRACQGVWEVVVIDSGSDIPARERPAEAQNVTAATVLGLSDEAIALCQATPVGVARFARVFADATNLRGGKPLLVCLNGVDTARRSLHDEATLREALRRFADVPHAHIIPRDTAACRQAEMAGVSVADAQPGSSLAKALGPLVSRWVEQVEARRRRNSPHTPDSTARTGLDPSVSSQTVGLVGRARILWERAFALR